MRTGVRAPKYRAAAGGAATVVVLALGGLLDALGTNSAEGLAHHSNGRTAAEQVGRLDR